MSTSRSSRSGAASIHPTRQQLEELDALLKRMLELPVNQVTETEAEPPVEPAPMTVRLARVPTSVPPPAKPMARDLMLHTPAPEPEIHRPPLQPREPEPPPQAVAPAPAELEPPVAPAAEEPPASIRLPVQPPHLFHRRIQPRVEESPEQEPQDIQDTSDPSDRPEDWVPLRSSWKPSPHTWPPLAESWHQAQQTGSDLPLVRRDDPVAQDQGPPPDAFPFAHHPSNKDKDHPLPPPVVPVAPVRLPAPPTTEGAEIFRLGTPSRKSAGPPEPIPEDSANDEPHSETILYPRLTFPNFEPEQAPRPTQHHKPAPLVAAPPPSTTEGAEIRPLETELGTPSRKSVGTPQTPGLPWLWRPLVWVNCAFTAVVALVGPPGRWLTGPAGRTMLGVAGILCLIGALGLVVADWLGWTW